MNKLFIVLFFLICVSCIEPQKHVDTKIVYTPQNAMDTIFSLPEIQQRYNLVDSLSLHKHGISMMVDSTTIEDSVYCIHVGYNGDLHFETYWTFYIEMYGKHKIKVCCPDKDSIIDLKAWKKIINSH